MDNRKKLQNFWFYHKNHLLIGLAALLVLSYLGIQKLSTEKPDYHIGLVRSVQLPQETLAAWEDLFAAAGADLNGDGQVLVQIHTYYVDLSTGSNADVVQALDADLIGGVSGIFLLEDVETFRRVTNGLLADSEVPFEEDLFLTLRKDASAGYLALAEALH